MAEAGAQAPKKSAWDHIIDFGEQLCASSWAVRTGYEAVPTSELEKKEFGSSDAMWHLDMYALDSLGIALSYFCVGFATNFVSTPVDYYLIDSLDASSAIINVLSTVEILPWCLKFVFGMMSDTYPIGTQRRKPYLIIGWTVFILSNLWLCALGEPGVSMIMLLVFLQTSGYIVSDVMNDAMVVERSKNESLDKRGYFQAAGYIARFFGAVIGSTLGAILYNTDSWGWGLTISQIFLLNALVPLVTVIPFIYPLVEVPPVHVPPSLKAQLLDMWDAGQLRAVWQPMSFVAFYNVMQISNPVWTNFLVDGLSFTEFDIGLISVASAVFSWLGLLAYKRYFFDTSWRMVYIGTTVINTIFSLLQLLLIFRINTLLGMPDLLFAVGDDAITQFILAVQFLPVCIMYIGLCPLGAEGAMYAMLTSYANLASSCGYNIGTLLTNVWDTSNSTLESGNFGGVWKLTVLTSCLQLVPLAFIAVLPNNKKDQMQLQSSNEKSFWGGVVFFGLFFAAMLWTVLESVIEIYY